MSSAMLDRPSSERAVAPGGSPGPRGRDIFLFYKEYEADKFVPGDRYLKRLLRPIWNMMHSNQKKTGFFVSFELMRDALSKAGYNVRANDYAGARLRPDYPVGVIGFPVILDNWKLPNPALLGPSLYDHPGLAPDLFRDPRFRKYLVLADWNRDMFAPVYGDRCVSWFAGIDLERWPSQAAKPKSFDFLVYDKVRWDHDRFQGELIDPVRNHLTARGFTFMDIRYKFHDQPTFRRLLSAAKGMIFLCEHETQGLAYQEALASGVPVLAWDRGYWGDPLWKRFDPKAPPASSVPFFSPFCGERFANLDEFPAALDRFVERLPDYDPRSYVASNLSQEESARIYADAYFSLLTQ